MGLVAIAFAAGEILKALTENGIGQRIIAAPEQDLEAVCRTAHRLFWGWCTLLFVVQGSVGLAISLYHGDDRLFWMMLTLAGQYLFMPAGLVQCFRAMREGQLQRTAAIAGVQIALSNILTAVLVLLWPHPLAAMLPKLLTAPVWLLLMRRAHAWRPSRGERAPLRYFLRFGVAVMGVELVRQVRLQADKFIVGALLGVEALGLYYLAFSAGLGVTASVTTAFATVVFPHLCAHEGRGARSQALLQAVIVMLLLTLPVVVAQSLLAPVYVPILFGDAWREVSDVIVILSWAAVPAVFWIAACQWLRSRDLAHRELMLSTVFGAVLLLSTAIAAPFGLIALALNYVLISALVQIGVFAALVLPERSFVARMEPA